MSSRCLIMTCLWWCGLAAAAQAPSFYEGTAQYPLPARNALVIPVSSVQEDGGFQSLVNPLNDAVAVTKALREAGFSVIALHEDRKPAQINRQIIKRALYEFAVTLRVLKGTGLVYFAGHGIARNGRLHLPGYDSYIRFDRDLFEELIPEELFYDTFAYAGNRINILVVDACRDYPLKETLDSFGKPPAAGPLVVPTGLVRFASTLQGHKAANGRNLSPFAAAFVDALKYPDEGLQRFKDRIEDHMVENGFDGQQPDSLIPPQFRQMVLRPTQATFNREQITFEEGKKTGDRKKLVELVNKPLGGFFARAAQQYLDSADLAPAAPQVTVALRQSAELRDGPAPRSQIVAYAPAGQRFEVMGAAVSANGRQWLPVALSTTSERVYVDAASTAIPATSRSVVPLTFKASDTPGVDALTDDALAQLKAAVERASRRIVRAEIIGVVRDGDGKSDPTPSSRLSARQAVVARALNALSVDGKTTAFAYQPAAKSGAGEDGVSVAITTEPVKQ